MFMYRHWVDLQADIAGFSPSSSSMLTSWAPVLSPMVMEAPPELSNCPPMPAPEASVVAQPMVMEAPPELSNCPPMLAPEVSACPPMPAPEASVVAQPMVMEAPPELSNCPPMPAPAAISLSDVLQLAPEVSAIPSTAPALPMVAELAFVMCEPISMFEAHAVM